MLSAAARMKGDEHGGVAILFGFSLLVLLMCAGAAVDFARGHSTKTALQQDLDATLLFVGKQKILEGDSYDAQGAAQAYIDNLRREKHAQGSIAVTVSEPVPNTLQATAVATVPTRLMNVFGFASMDIAVESHASVGQQPVEIALVLDNTLSMSGAKIDALKTAATDLVDTVFDGPNADQNVKISVVPFAEYVNVGMGNRNVSWMSVPPDTSTTQNVCSTYQEPAVVPGSCRDMTGSYLVDGVPTSYTYQQCDYTYGPPTTQCNDVTTETKWYGCAGSRAYPLNTLDQDYSNPVPGVMNVSCPTEVTPLTDQRDTVKNAISAMSTTGNTYIPAGLMWGWATLSKNAPYDQAEDAINGQKVRKIMVLMTDGFNTLSPTVPHNGSHFGSDTAQSNTYTQELCSNIKAQKVTIYTVAFDVTDANIKSILESCASSPGNYFDASNASELQEAFEKIAADFSPLRLTQ
jgi:Mg-chelatase subunit ChlD